MGFTWYADSPGRRTRQVVSDLFFLLWCGLWIWVAVKLHDLIVPLGTPARSWRMLARPSPAI